MPGPEDYFSKLKGIFDTTAALSGGPLCFDHRIASCRLRLCFANRTLVPWLTPALSHLETMAVDPPHLTISIWDETSASSPMPAPPWSWERYMSRGEVGVTANTPFRVWFHIGSGVFSMINLQSNQALLWVKTPFRLPIHVAAAPLRMILQAWFSQRELFFAHAAAVGNAAGAVLLAGDGGAGKSTTSLACLAGGLDFLGDDYCLFGSNPEPAVHSTYCSAKLDPRMLQRLPALQPAVSSLGGVEEDKVLLMLRENFAARLAPSRRILALLTPQVADRADTTIEKISALAGIRSLAPSTMQQIAGPDPAAWRAITSLARQVSSYRINVGYDLKLIPRRIEALLEQLA